MKIRRYRRIIAILIVAMMLTGVLATVTGCSDNAGEGKAAWPVEELVETGRYADE